MVSVEKSKVQVAVSQREEIEALVKEQRSAIAKMQKASVSAAPRHRNIPPEGTYPPQVDEVMAELIWLRERQRGIETQAQTGTLLPSLLLSLLFSFLTVCFSPLCFAQLLRCRAYPLYILRPPRLSLPSLHITLKPRLLCCMR